MVRAILAGTKTQTRRVVKPGRRFDAQAEWELTPTSDGRAMHRTTADGIVFSAQGGHLAGSMQDAIVRCPYGKPGDRLWVREAWRRDIFDDTKTLYRASHGDRTVFDKWVPSIHMPRDRSRITLDITSVRVERLQDISIADCIAEGIARGGPENPDGIERDEYRRLWESINGADSWDANPWVWVVAWPAFKGGGAS
jgi:hypothetical protein